MVTSYKLVLQSGPNAGTEYPIEKGELYLGRDANNDIVINDPEVSRRHARIVRQGDDYFYEDLGSTNGSFILGQRLSTLTMLHPGVTLMIGENVVINYVVTSTDPSATVAAPRRQRQAIPPPSMPVTPAPVPMPQVAPVMSMPAPQMQMPPVQMPMPQKKSKAGITILIIVAIILVFCIIPWIIIDATKNWCNLFPGIFNMIQAGTC
jgi:hypothetical protein